MRKLNFGCGGNRLEGWENYDLEIPIDKPLPFPDECASFILAEHVLEHVTIQEAWNFLAECRRVLRKDGVLRIAVPDITRIFMKYQPIYGLAIQAGGFGASTLHDSIKSAVFNHGHKALWTPQLLITILICLDFSAAPREYGKSAYEDLQNIEGHHKVVGLEVAKIETTIVEAMKVYD